jgi:pyridoxamine 5'-phosphate oxidase family protein
LNEEMVSSSLLSKVALSSSVAKDYQTYIPEPAAEKRQERMTRQRSTSVRFTEKESEYLMTQRLARVATVSPSGQPHVVPIVYEFDGQFIYFSGWNIARSVKFRNLQMNNKIAIVVDDLASHDRWSPRGIEIKGTAEPVHSDGGTCLKITPLKKASWGI